MATLEQLSSALVGADAAGDAEAARMLAAEITKIRQPQMGNAVTDVIPEIKKAFSENLAAAKGGLLDNPQKSAIGGLLDTGKGLLGIAGMAASPITGAARSLLGHPLASATHAAGTLINPEVAAKDDPKQMYEHAKEGVDTAMMAVAPRGASPVGMRAGPAPPTPSGAALKSDAVDTLNHPAIKAIPIPAGDAAGLSSIIESDLLRKGFRPTPGSAPGTMAEVKRMVPDASVSAVNVDDIRAARRALNMTAAERNPIGKPTPDAAAATAAIREIDNYLDTVSPALREANANYAAGSAAQTLDYRNIKAQHRAAKSGSGSNIENTMRQEVDKIQDRGLRPAEIAARNQIVEGTTARNALRKVGKLGFGDGASLMYHAALAIPTLGMNVPVGAMATVARKIGEALTRSEIRALSEQIRSRAPTSQALLAAPRSPQRITNQTRAIAAALLGGNRGQIPYMSSVMPGHADQNER